MITIKITRKYYPFQLNFQMHRDILIAQDLQNRIGQHLSQKLTQTYDLLLKGYSPVEIADRFNLTYEAMRVRIKKIRQIARSYW